MSFTLEYKHAGVNYYCESNTQNQYIFNIKPLQGSIWDHRTGFNSLNYCPITAHYSLVKWLQHPHHIAQ